MSGFCDVPVECVITSQDASSIYEVPLNLEREGLAHQALELLQLGTTPTRLNTVGNAGRSPLQPQTTGRNCDRRQICAPERCLPFGHGSAASRRDRP